MGREECDLCPPIAPCALCCLLSRKAKRSPLAPVTVSHGSLSDGTRLSERKPEQQKCRGARRPPGLIFSHHQQSDPLMLLLAVALLLADGAGMGSMMSDGS